MTWIRLPMSDAAYGQGFGGLGAVDSPGNLRLAARSSGLKKPSVVNVSQLITIDKTRLTEKVKKLDERTLRKVEDGLRLVLNL